MENWIIFWTVVFFLSLAIFYFTVLLIIPFGIRDLWSLFKLLDQRRITAQMEESKPSDSPMDKDKGQ